MFSLYSTFCVFMICRLQITASWHTSLCFVNIHLQLTKRFPLYWTKYFILRLLKTHAVTKPCKKYCIKSSKFSYCVEHITAANVQFIFKYVYLLFSNRVNNITEARLGYSQATIVTLQKNVWISAAQHKHCSNS